MTVDQIINFSLLDYLAYKTHCAYLSDLPRVARWELVRRIEEVPPEAFSAKDWRDTVAYLTKTQELGRLADSREAKQALLHLMGGWA